MEYAFHFISVNLVKFVLVYAIVFQTFYNVRCEDCVPRKYSFDSIVCVCNATYCDTIPKIRPPLKGNYVLYTSTQDGQRFQRSVGNFQKKQSIQGNDRNNGRIKPLKTTVESLFSCGLNYASVGALITPLPESSSSCSPLNTAHCVVLNINKKIQHQEIIGFGAAFTDSAGMNLLSLQPNTQDLLLKSYYSLDGLEYSLGRVPIGGTDFSTRGYTYSDENEDAALSGFNLTAEDFTYKIPIIKRAQSFSNYELKLTASCWSPPAWMKTNHRLAGYGVLKEEYYRAYADYHVKFLDAYKKEGIKFWCITTGNEPMNGLIWFNKINALGWSALSQRKWIGENLGPQMRSSHPDTCILAGDDQRYVFPWWLRSLLEDKQAAQYINGSGVHWYWDFIVPPMFLRKTHDMFPNLFIINTESSYGDKPWDLFKVALGSWKRATDYAFDIIASFNNWVAGWIDWNFALNEQGGPTYISNFIDAAIIINKTADEFYKQPMYYALGHFSKFIPPGSHRVKNTVTPARQLSVLTVQRPDNFTTAVILNTNSYDIKLTVMDSERGTAILNIPKQSICSLMYR